MAVSDAEAWGLAIAMLRHTGEPIEINAVVRLLQDDGLEQAGRWAAHAMQFRTLHSKPWLMLPCGLGAADVDRILARGDGGSDLRGERVAAVLWKRMQRQGISRFHPDPEHALREAERKPAA
jgi:hypothetical protein